jgi:hypothetical protein
VAALSKADYETYVVRLGRRHGKPYAERKPLNVPWALARGNYEELSDLAVREFFHDIKAEHERRSLPAAPPTSNGYDPAASQIRTPSKETT